MNDGIRILFVGDVVGSAGRRTLQAVLPRLRERTQLHFVVVNGENAAGGHGITSKIARDMFAAGVDVITLGNHTYRQNEVYAYLDQEERILRPANFLRGQPGHGTCVVTNAAGDVRLGVVSLSGNLYMNSSLPAFSEADAALYALREKADHILVDMHAEATSEKVGLGWYLDGRVTAVVGRGAGPTADARVLPPARPPGGRRHDRRPWWRTRGQARAGDRRDAHTHAGAVRGLRGGPLAAGRADRVCGEPMRALSIVSLQEPLRR